MNKITSIACGSALLIGMTVLPIVSFAQTTNSTNTNGTGGTMPQLYNQAGGTQVNGQGAANLSPGWYYTSSGSQVYYYGNGTYYDPATQTYGGSINNPGGTAGSFQYGTYNGSNTGTSGAPGVPNTGVGGDAPTNWFILLASGMLAMAGALYVTKQVAY